MIDFEAVNDLMAKIEKTLDCEAYMQVEMERREIATFGERYKQYVPGRQSLALQLGFRRPHTYNNYFKLFMEPEDLKFILENEHAQAWFINTYLDGIRYLDGDFAFTKALFPDDLPGPKEVITLDAMKETYEVD